jgi:hypothetical protein
MDMQTIQLRLGAREAAVLSESISALLTEIRDEIAHTDDPAFRDGLYAKLDTLENIRRRLALSAPA